MSSATGSLGPMPLPAGVKRYHVWLLRLMFVLMATVLAFDVWPHIFSAGLTERPYEAVAWALWAAFSVLAVLGVVNPLKTLPLVLLEIIYKLLWLAIVALPLASDGVLAGSSAEAMTIAFVWVVLPIVATPWKYVWRTYIRYLRCGPDLDGGRA